MISRGGFISNGAGGSWSGGSSQDDVYLDKDEIMFDPADPIYIDGDENVFFSKEDKNARMYIEGSKVYVERVY